MATGLKEMKVETRRRVRIVLLLVLAVAVVRLGLIWYGRHNAAQPAKGEAAAPGLNPDYYVVPKKLYLYDVKSAREQLAGRSVWVREGYRYTYFPYSPASHRVDFKHEAGLLASLEKLDIRDVIQSPPPEPGAQPQIMAVFVKDGKDYALPIGSAQGKDATIYADEMLFYQDPHELYKHWPPGVWKAIDEHHVLPGMTEMQISFAIGMGVPQRAADTSTRTVVYPNGGKPVTVTFRDGKAAEIRQGS
jgi:hypothetical protein